jgi:tetrapyrrole methylase family protein/MazG family protein
MQVPTPPNGPPAGSSATGSTASSGSLRRLVDLVARLRAPDGCPWDREQSLEDLRAYLLEEAHEAAAAIDTGDREELAVELGDLAFLTAFVARLAEEEGAFTIEEVLDRAAEKIVHRHPHVFGEARLESAEEVRRAWEERKAEQKGEGDSLLAGVPSSLPALVAAYRLSQKAAGVGFDWSDAGQVLDKIEEEVSELREALKGPPRDTKVAEEIGDLLFAVANLSRKLGRDPEAALAATNRKFRDRFAYIESQLAERGRSLKEATLEEMEALWQQAKDESPG